MFRGVLTALVTPMRDGEVDTGALRRLVEEQIGAGIHGQVVCGTTGEAAALTPAEWDAAVGAVVEQARGRVPVIAGTGSNNTRAAVECTRRAAELGVDGVLVVTPYYVKPPLPGLLAHYRQVAAVGLPVVAYNVPSRTGLALDAAGAAALAGIDGVVALKEASGDMKLDGHISSAVEPGFGLLSGDDFTFLPLLALGGTGCISVVANAAPRLTAALYERFVAGDLAAARVLQLKLLPLMRALFLQPNPIPVKAALAMMGRIGPEIRTPLAELDEAHRPALQRALAELDLLEATS